MIAAVVRASDGVRFTATGRWANDVVPALAGYVAERCDDVLWPALKPLAMTGLQPSTRIDLKAEMRTMWSKSAGRQG